MRNPNVLSWDGAPGHYEVYYLTTTDPATGVGLWIRYTMLAPRGPAGEPSAALWFLAMDPRPESRGVFARKEVLPITTLEARGEPFSLRIGDSLLTDEGMSGGFGDVRWDLRWARGRAAAHVHPLLRGIASTILVLPHADVTVSGTVAYGEQRLELHDAPGGQAHLWGRKHATSWAWVHCNDFRETGDAFLDGVSVFVPRFGRQFGPNTPIVGRFAGRDFASISPLRVVRNASEFSLTEWRFEAVCGERKLLGEVSAEPDLLAGVTYTDPDGERAYCYNSEAASLRLTVLERAGRRGAWQETAVLTAPGRAHFEYAQREPVQAAAIQLA